MSRLAVRTRPSKWPFRSCRELPPHLKTRELVIAVHARHGAAVNGAGSQGIKFLVSGSSSAQVLLSRGHSERTKNVRLVLTLGTVAVRKVLQVTDLRRYGVSVLAAAVELFDAAARAHRAACTNAHETGSIPQAGHNAWERALTSVSSLKGHACTASRQPAAGETSPRGPGGRLAHCARRMRSHHRVHPNAHTLQMTSNCRAER